MLKMEIVKVNPVSWSEPSIGTSYLALAIQYKFSAKTTMGIINYLIQRQEPESFIFQFVMN